MKSITIDDQKRIQIEILNKLADYCIKKNLDFYLGFGSLLGAVRHSGFIPWDDDIDIIMPRNDYEKLIQEFYSIESELCLSTISNNCSHIYTFAKLYDDRTIKIEQGYADSQKVSLGVGIDIFPIDGLPTNQKTMKRHEREIYQLFRLLLFATREKTKSKNMIKGIIKSFLAFLSRRFLKRHIIKRLNIVAKKYKFDRAEYVAVTVAPYEGRIFPVRKSLFESKLQIKFEGRYYPCPIGYDEYLTVLYGEYMQLPPLEEQKSHHRYEAFWKNNHDLPI